MATEPTAREAQKQKTRAAIAEAARRLFEANGYEGTTLRAVARTAGVAVGSIFVHFPGKSQLLSHILATDLRRILSECSAGDTMVRDGETLLEKLLQAPLSFYRYYAARPELSRVLVKEVVVMQPAERPEMERFTQEYLGRIETTLRETRARGLIRSQADPQLLAYTLFSQYLLVLLHMLSHPDPDPDAAGVLLRRMHGEILTAFGPTEESRK